jgi:hypothetical protein
VRVFRPVSDEIRSFLGHLPQATFLPKPDGFVTILRGYIPDDRVDEVDAFVIAAGGAIEEAPSHYDPSMSADPRSVEMVAGEPYYAVPVSALGAPVRRPAD